MLVRRAFLGLSACSIAALTLSRAYAGEAINAKSGGLAVKGYDVVAYFTEGRPMVGDPQHEHEWRGVRWRFVSGEHKEAFALEPARFAPRYGGFCAGGMARGRKAPIDPEAFVIHNGKLYLHFSHASADNMLAAPKPMIDSADGNWARLGRRD